MLGVSCGLGSAAPSMTLGLLAALCVVKLELDFLAFSVTRGSALCRVDMLILCHKE